MSRFNLRSPLLGTFLLAALLVGLATGWLLADEQTNRSEALRTGGFAGGAVVALYALWLNDRRRRVEEDRKEVEVQRQDLESGRTEHDRERVADERFARAIELLGNEADQVRVGALHALAGLASSRPAYTQTVLDVLCSYLRRPFDHPTYARTRDATWVGNAELAERERVVRVTAQELIARLLPEPSTGSTAYNLDLTGATLEYFDVAHRLIGTLTARHVHLYSSNSLHHSTVRGDLWLTGAHSWGQLHAHDCVFGGRAWFSGFRSLGPVSFARTEFHGRTKFRGAEFSDTVSLRDAALLGPLEADETGVIHLNTASGETSTS